MGKPCPHYRNSMRYLVSGAKKEPQSQKVARTAPKNFLNSSRGLPVITKQTKGFEANCARKFTRTIGKIFVTQFLILLGSDFVAKRIFCRFLLLSRRIFFADFVAGFFLLIFVGKSARKILRENPRQNPPKFIQQRSPTHFCGGAGPISGTFSVPNHLQ